MKMSKQKRPKFKELPLHKDARKPRNIVRFYNDLRVKRQKKCIAKA